MLNIASPISPDFSVYEKSIRADGAYVYVDTRKYKLLLNNFIGKLNSARAQLEHLLALASLNQWREVSSDAVIHTLIDYCGLNERDLQIRNAYKEYVYSLDQVKVLEPLKQRLDSHAATAQEGYRLASEIVDAYLTYREYKTIVDNARAKIKRFRESDKKGWFGDLSEIDFVYEQKDTGRYYTKNDNLQAWNLNMVPCITVPKDYFLVWADFAQIDFRVAYHVYLKQPNSEYDAIYKSEDDKYLAMYKIMCKALGQDASVEKFKKRRKAFKKAILSAVYNAAERSLAVDMKDAELAKSLYTYVYQNPGYKWFREVLDRVIQFGVEVPVHDYFGFTRVIPLPSSKDYWATNQVVSKGCNTPIQATSNGILMLWLEAVLQGFESKGFSREKHVIPYLVRHDEVIFMVHQSVMPYLWVFQEFMKIALDDWDLLELEPHIGLYYKEPSAELEAIFNQQVKEHEGDYTPRLVNAPRVPEYRPISDVITIYTYTMHTPVEYAKIHGAPAEALISNEVAEDWIKQQAALEADSNQDCSRWVRFHDHFFVYSPKLKKYKCVTDFVVATDLANAIGSQFVSVQNVTFTGSSFIDGIYYQFELVNSFMVSNLLAQMEELKWPTQWVELK